MLGSGPNQYIQPDYLGPLPSTLDSKQSPLALLAQTCSQIGADSTPPQAKLLEASKRKISTCSESSDKGNSNSSSSNNHHHQNHHGGDSSSSSSSNNNRPKSSSSTASSKDSIASSKSNNHNNNNNVSLTNGKVSPPTSGERSKSKSPMMTTNTTNTTAFRPYESSSSSSRTHKSESNGKDEVRSGGNCSPVKTNSGNSPGPDTKDKGDKSESSSENRKRSQSSSHQHSGQESKKPREESGSGSNNSNGGKSNSSSTPPTSASSSSSSSAAKDTQGTSPIIRSGLEVLQGSDNYRTNKFPHHLAHPFAGLYPHHPHAHPAFGGFPFDPTNPAFRPPFMSNGHHPHPHLPPHLGGMGIPTSASSLFPHQGGSPYIGYSRIKTATGGESIVPVCKDPYCTGCQFSGGGGASASSICPIGCVHPCDHPKLPNPFLGLHPGGLGGNPFLPPGLGGGGGYPPGGPSSLPAPPTSTAGGGNGSASSVSGRPYVCNWIVGDSYCGKRFVSSEELLQHLRTHPTTTTAPTPTSNSSSVSSSAAAEIQLALQQQAAAAYSSLLNSMRPYPTPPLSPLDSSRYNPYALMKGLGGFPPGLPPPPPPHPGSILSPPTSHASGGLPPSLASLYAANPYASLYGQKVHP